MDSDRISSVDHPRGSLSISLLDEQVLSARFVEGNRLIYARGRIKAAVRGFREFIPPFARQLMTPRVHQTVGSTAADKLKGWRPYVNIEESVGYLSIVWKFVFFVYNHENISCPQILRRRPLKFVLLNLRNHHFIYKPEASL